MKNTIRKMVILTLAATIFLSACHRQGIDSENEVITEDTMIAESDQETENNAETQQEIHPLDVGVLGHTERNGALTAKALEEDYDTQNESFFPAGNVPNEWKVCVYDTQRQGYTVHYYEVNPQDTLGQLIRTAIGYLYQPEDGLDLADVKIEKGFAIINLSLTPDSNAESSLTDQESVEALLNSVAATVCNNGLYEAGFLLNGGQFSLGGVTLEEDGYGHYEAPDLYNQPITEEEFTELRSLMTYPGEKQVDTVLESNQTVIEEYPELYSLIAFAGDTGEYTSLQKLDNQAKLDAGFHMVPDTYTCNSQPELYPDYPENDEFLAPLIFSIMDDSFTPKEWIETAIQKIWGEGVSCIHENTTIYTYHEEQGVYTPPHRGGAIVTEPYFHQIEQTEDGYTAQVSYVKLGAGGVLDEKDEWIPVYENYEQDAAVQELIEQKLPRYQIKAEYDKAGNLHLISSQLITE